MIDNVTSLSRTGVRDWLIQRVSAVVLGLFLIFLLAYFAANPQLDYDSWKALFAHTWMRVFAVLALLSLLLHSWVGIWTVFTDYIKCVYARIFLQVIVILGLFAYLIWGIAILWRS